MTDAKFMLEYVARERAANQNEDQNEEPCSRPNCLACKALAERESELEALEALVKLKWNQHILWCIDPGVGKMCERCEALRKFRAAVEGE